MLIFTILHVIHQSSVPGKFFMLIFTNSAYQFQKNSAIYKDQKKPVLTSMVSIETAIVSACIFHVSAPKPEATNQLQVCYSGTLQGPRKPILPLTVSVENVMESAHC